MTIAFNGVDAVAVRRRLLRWYDGHKRDLPWRRRAGNAYAQLVAEFMLQQTQVKTVIPYYERFLKRFPTAAALADAELDDVLTLWSGLGYYRRARHLHAAAGEIVRRHGGEVPRTVAELAALPGIGRYTAGAIASIAYGVRAPVLDGNVTRVLMRLLGVEADPRSPQTKETLWAAAEALLPARRCGDFNQAMMELGATLCVPRQPECSRCPWRGECQARAGGLVDRIPPVRQRAVPRAAAIAVAAIRAGERLLFEQRGDKGLWAGLWELPSEPLAPHESPSDALQRLRSRLPVRARLTRAPLPPVVRVLTHRRITFHLFVGSAERTASSGSFRWVRRREIPGMGLSRACQVLLEQVGWE